MKIPRFFEHMSPTLISIIFWSGIIFMTFGIVTIDNAISTAKKIKCKNENPIINNTLPESASNVTSLGRGWFTFELEVNNKKRKFLFKTPQYGESLGNEVITELKD